MLMTTVLDQTPLRADDVSKKKKPPKDGDTKPGPGRPSIGGKQIGVRLGEELQAAMEEISKGMGLDMSSAIRSILMDVYRPYLDRIRRRQQQDEASGD